MAAFNSCCSVFDNMGDSRSGSAGFTGPVTGWGAGCSLGADSLVSGLLRAVLGWALGKVGGSCGFGLGSGGTSMVIFWAG
jgi:hypothetical protein